MSNAKNVSTNELIRKQMFRHRSINRGTCGPKALLNSDLNDAGQVARASHAACSKVVSMTKKEHTERVAI